MGRRGRNGYLSATSVASLHVLDNRLHRAVARFVGSAVTRSGRFWLLV